MKIKYNLKILDDGLTIQGQILETIFEEGEKRGDFKHHCTQDGCFYLCSNFYPELATYGLAVHGNNDKNDSIICNYRYSSKEEAKQVMERINEFTIQEEEFKEKGLKEEELKERDIVYVSNISEEDALIKKNKRIFLTKIGKVNICVTGISEDDYKLGEYFEVNNWKYVVKKPVEEKIERKLILTNSEWEEVKKILNIN